MNVDLTTMKKSELSYSDVPMSVQGRQPQAGERQWEMNSHYLQRLVGELVLEMAPMIQKMEEQLDDEWDRFQEHRGEFARAFLTQLRAFSSTSYKNPEQFYQSVRRIASMWATLSKAQKGLDSRVERESTSQKRYCVNGQ
jgi:hypothetical protein